MARFLGIGRWILRWCGDKRLISFASTYPPSDRDVFTVCEADRLMSFAARVNFAFPAGYTRWQRLTLAPGSSRSRIRITRRAAVPEKLLLQVRTRRHLVDERILDGRRTQARPAGRCSPGRTAAAARGCVTLQRELAVASPPGKLFRHMLITTLPRDGGLLEQELGVALPQVWHRFVHKEFVRSSSKSGRDRDSTRRLRLTGPRVGPTS